MDADRIKGALLGTAVGDALGMPVEGLSHQNVRTYYKGIKAYRADDQRRDLGAGQWTDDTQMTFALARALAESAVVEELPARAAAAYVALLPEARRWGPTTRAAVERLSRDVSWEASAGAERPTDGAAMRAAPLGAWWAAVGASREEAWPLLRAVFSVTHRHPDALAAGFGQAFAVCRVLQADPAAFDREAFWRVLTEATAWAEEQLDATGRVAGRLRALAGHLDEFPLDLQDRCDGAGVYAHEAWPFAVAMFARAPHLIEATLLSTVNVGGDADTTGAMTGALLGALHGWQAFPRAWRADLEAASRLEAEAEALVERLRALPKTHVASGGPGGL